MATLNIRKASFLGSKTKKCGESSDVFCTALYKKYFNNLLNFQIFFLQEIQFEALCIPFLTTKVMCIMFSRGGI